MYLHLKNVTHRSIDPVLKISSLRILPLSTSAIHHQYADPPISSPSKKTNLLPADNLIDTTTNIAPCHDQSANFNHHIPSDIVSSNKKITSYIRAGDLHSALTVFNNMKVRTTVTWNSMLAGYGKSPGRITEAHQLFDRIPEPDVVSYNIMLAFYILQEFGIERAWSFFNQMPVKDVASWNTMISGFCGCRKMDRARELFVAMPGKNSVTWNAMISGFSECGDMSLALEMFKLAPFKSAVAWTAMISGYMKSGEIELAERLFREMPTKVLVTWNAMIAGHVENSRAEDGLKIFKMMLSHQVQPNSSSLSSVLLGCSELSALQLGRQVHQFIYKSLIFHDVTAGTSLVSMYYKCGVLEDAWKLFQEMPRRDVISWNAMISGYAQHGAGKRSLSLFEKMKDEGVKPDSITFVAVLLACNHAGLVDHGLQYFDSMVKDYGLEPRPDHFTCMVDLLGRAGKLVEAVDMINKMPYRPHAAIFGTLLGACRIHKNLDVAEYAAQKLLDLEPKSAAAYVQLANLYAALNKWNHVARVRRSMRENKVIKTPGYSWIEIKSVVHRFRSGDRLHPELFAIHKKLSELEQKMKVAGHVPDLESALHDVEEDQKEKLLLWHSEKLAVAFGLLMLPLGNPIRVFKNLRICGDCHRAIKYISAVESREIIVRDTRRFHHFQDGCCSCGDYW